MIIYQILLSFHHKGKKLFQLKHQKIIEKGTKANGNSTKTNGNTSHQKIISLMMIDCEDERVVDKEANLRVISDLKGYSQINYKDSLYLCGSNNELSCSFLLSIDFHRSNDIEILINSQYPHVYPSLTIIEGHSFGQSQIEGQLENNICAYIIVVGGLKQLDCESYDIVSSSWTKLPELPEERYHCTLMPNQQKTHVYLFGGYSSESGSNSNTILRLSISFPLVWETILIKENAGLLCRNSCACIYSKNTNTFILIGGVNNEKEMGDMIIEFDPLKRKANQSITKLKYQAKFRNQSGYEIRPNDYSIIDSNGRLHKINLININLSISEEY